MARKRFAVDEAMREKVRYLAGLGVSQDDIAKIIGCAPKTLRKRLRNELDRGVAEANATISGHLFAAAKAGNVIAQIFWLKTRAHWREKTAPDEPISGGDAEVTSPAVLVLPDNCRDAELTQVLRDAQAKYFARKPRPVASGTQSVMEARAAQAEHTENTLPDDPGGNGQSASAAGM